MTCPRNSEETHDLLLEYSAGKLDANRQAAVEAHLRDCAECQTFHREQAALWSALDVWEPEPVSLDFNRRLWQRIEKTNAAPWYRQLGESLRFAAWKPVFPLAAAAAMIIGGFVLDHRGALPVTNSATASSMEAEQAEAALNDLQLLKQLDTVSASTM